MPEQPYLLNAKNPQNVLRQTQYLVDDLYRERIAGALQGDVLLIDNETDILTLQLAATPGLTKAGSALSVLPDPAGPVYISSAGVNVHYVSATTGQRAGVFNVPGTLTFLTSVAPVIILPWAGSFVKAWAYVKTAPAAQAIIFDINLNGSTIWSTQDDRVRIAAAANLGSQTSFDTTTFSVGDILTLDVDQVGTGTVGADATVEIVISI